MPARSEANLNPRTVLAWCLAALVIALGATNPVYRLVVCLTAINFLVAWRRPGLSLRPVLALFLIAAPPTIAINLLANHNGQVVLASLPRSIPTFGGPITLESGVLGLSIVLGLATAGLAVAPLWLVLEPHQLIDAMPRYLQRTGIAVAASLNLVPQVARSFVNVREAERLRGGAGGMRGFFELLLPVTLTTLEDSLGLAEAMEARGYGSGPRSSFAGTSRAYRDWLIAAAAGAALAIFVLSLLAGLNPSWDPSVRLSPPAVSPVALLACLLLAVPALLTSA